MATNAIGFNAPWCRSSAAEGRLKIISFPKLGGRVLSARVNILLVTVEDYGGELGGLLLALRVPILDEQAVGLFMQAFEAAVFFVDDGAHGPKPLGEAVGVRPTRILISIGAVKTIQAFYFTGVISPRKARRRLPFFRGGRRCFARYPSPNSIEKRFSNCLKGIGMALPLNLEAYSVRGDFKGSGKETGQVLPDNPQDFAKTCGTGARFALPDLLGSGRIR